MKVKLFTPKRHDSDVETQINDWLTENPKVDVIQLAQSDGGGDHAMGLKVTLLYKDAPKKKPLGMA